MSVRHFCTLYSVTVSIRHFLTLCSVKKCRTDTIYSLLSKCIFDQWSARKAPCLPSRSADRAGWRDPPAGSSGGLIPRDPVRAGVMIFATFSHFDPARKAYGNCMMELVLSPRPGSLACRLHSWIAAKLLKGKGVASGCNGCAVVALLSTARFLLEP